jgi:hypothetical protein
MFYLAQVCAVKSNVLAVILVAVDIRVIVVALLHLYVLYQVESHAFNAVWSAVVICGRSSHVQRPIVVVVVVVFVYAAIRESVPFFLLHFLFILGHELSLREIFLVLLVVEHFVARIHLLNAELRFVIVVGHVDVVVVVQVHARRVGIVDERRLGLDVVSDVGSVLVDDVVGMLEVTGCRLSHMARIVELLLLCLELKRLLLLLLAVLRGIVGLVAFSFTLPFLGVVRCALWSRRNFRKLEFHS